jgi:hypothetical protein
MPDELLFKGGHVVTMDPVAVMVLGAGPADVETVIVEGDVVKRDGKLVGANVDWPASSCTRPATTCAADRSVP